MTYKIEQVTMFRAPDGSVYNSEGEAATAVLQTAISALAGVNADALKAAVATPASAPADLLDAIDALSAFFAQAKAEPVIVAPAAS